MKRLIVLFIYFCVFWLFLPIGLIYLGQDLDRRFQFVAAQNQTLRQIGFALIIGGGICFLESVRQFRKYGGVWPVSAYPPNHLIRNGFFAWWRHPIYLFFTLTLFGVGLCLESKGFLFIVYPGFLLFEYGYLKWEEARLEKRFPNEYPYYRRTTGLIAPRLYQTLKIPFRILFAVLFKYQKKAESAPAPKPPFFVVAYHRNYLDPFLIAAAIPMPISYVTTFDMFRGCLSRLLFQKLFGIPKRRFRSDIDCVKQLVAVIKEGGVVGIFPEGERSWTGAPGVFKLEALTLFQKFSTTPILPARLSGNYHAWPRWGNRARKSKVKVVLGEPIKLPANASLTEINSLLVNALKTDEEFALCESKNFAKGLPNLIYRCPVCFAFETFPETESSPFSCLQCGARFFLKNDYSLVFEKNGNIVRQSLRKTYQSIRVRKEDLAESFQSDSAAILLKTGEKYLGEIESCELSETDDRKFRLLSAGSLAVTNKRIFSQKVSGATITLSQVRSITIEGNRKLQLYLPKNRRLFQIVLKKGSVLRWHDFLIWLLKVEHNITPNHF